MDQLDSSNFLAGKLTPDTNIIQAFKEIHHYDLVEPRVCALSGSIDSISTSESATVIWLKAIIIQDGFEG